MDAWKNYRELIDNLSGDLKAILRAEEINKYIKVSQKPQSHVN